MLANHGDGPAHGLGGQVGGDRAVGQPDGQHEPRLAVGHGEVEQLGGVQDRGNLAGYERRR
jgi:hypothetical protein